jgi:NADH dehydrogenase
MVTLPTVAAPTHGISRRTRVVILGGGFAGIYTARRLERALRRRDDFEILLINKENYFVFQPMLPEVISGTIGIVDTVIPIRRLLPRTELHVREVESIDLARRVVITSTGFEPRSDEIAFDHLVLALGNVTDFRGLPGLPEHALAFKNLADALAVRTHIIRALEEAAIERRDPRLRQRLLTFVIAGGGFSGVEVAAEINDFVRAVARYYRGIDPSEIRVILLHARDRILPEVSEKLALFAQRILRRRGVELRLKTRLAAATADGAILSSGEQLPTKTLVSTIPASPHPILDALDLPKEKNGRLHVDSNLRVEGSDNLWALGDCAWVTIPDGTVSPPTAQHATRQAETAATNLVAAIRGTRETRFNFGGLGNMGSLGHRCAVAEFMDLQLSGFLAWFVWRTVYLAKLPGWGRRLKVAVSWTLDLFLPPDLVQLRLSGSAGMLHEHFEPGQIVFQQGDVGDRLYIILDGEAEVVREHDGSELAVAHLGPGEYFGELALMEHQPRNATVRCVSSMNTVSVPKRDFGTLSAYLPALRESFETVARRRHELPQNRS